MKGAFMDRTEEKVALAEELGLTSYVDQKKQLAEERSRQLELQREIKEMTDMGFKHITKEQIRKKICNRITWHGFDTDPVSVLLCGVLAYCVALLFLMMGAVIFTGVEKAFNFMAGGTLFKFAILISPMSILFGFRKPELSFVLLSEWKDELPYGALLAVKEAKEKGFKHFEIYYPTKNYVRLKVDQVIVGSKNCRTQFLSYSLSETRDVPTAPLYEIFSWDDGKVYE